MIAALFEHVRRRIWRQAAESRQTQETREREREGEAAREWKPFQFYASPPPPVVVVHGTRENFPRLTRSF